MKACMCSNSFQADIESTDEPKQASLHGGLCTPPGGGGGQHAPMCARATGSPAFALHGDHLCHLPLCFMSCGPNCLAAAAVMELQLLLRADWVMLGKTVRQLAASVAHGDLCGSNFFAP